MATLRFAKNELFIQVFVFCSFNFFSMPLSENLAQRVLLLLRLLLKISALSELPTVQVFSVVRSLDKSRLNYFVCLDLVCTVLISYEFSLLFTNLIMNLHLPTFVCFFFRLKGCLCFQLYYRWTQRNIRKIGRVWWTDFLKTLTVKTFLKQIFQGKSAFEENDTIWIINLLTSTFLISFQMFQSA